MKKNLLWLLLATVCLIPTVWAQDAPPAAVSRTYLIGPGDEITIRVFGERDFDGVAAVDENGNIELPISSTPIPVMCKSEGELRTDITKILGKYLRNPQVGVSVTARKSRPPVTVSGEVKSQQQVVLTRKTRLWELVTFSGGITDDAGGMIEVFRTQPPLCAEPGEMEAWKAEADANKEFGGSARLYSISTVQQGRDESNPVIYPGDIINVQRGKPIFIVGEVRNGQGLMLKEGGLQLSQAIAMVGGVNGQAKTKDIKIYRRKPDSIDREIISVNLDSIKKEGTGDVPLQPYDIVEVGKAKESISSIILRTVTGAGTAGLGGLTSGVVTRILY